LKVAISNYFFIHFIDFNVADKTIQDGKTQENFKNF